MSKVARQTTTEIRQVNGELRFVTICPPHAACGAETAEDQRKLFDNRDSEYKSRLVREQIQRNGRPCV